MPETGQAMHYCLIQKKILNFKNREGKVFFLCYYKKMLKYICTCKLINEELVRKTSATNKLYIYDYIHIANYFTHTHFILYSLSSQSISI